LYFRLNVVPLELPALHQRREDIEQLAQHFFKMFAELHSLSAPSLSKSTEKVLRTYAWPGNVRELRNLCERLSILLPGKIIEPENLPREFSISQQPAQDNSFILPEFGLQLEALEADMIMQALNRTKGNRSKSARLLGISRDTLLYRMQKHGLASH
jgi:DNA-binding NtrC family response regulator